MPANFMVCLVKILKFLQQTTPTKLKIVFFSNASKNCHQRTKVSVSSRASSDQSSMQRTKKKPLVNLIHDEGTVLTVDDKTQLLF